MALDVSFFMPSIVLVREGMMYPVAGKSTANWGIGSIAVDDEFSTFPFDVPTLIVAALVLVGPCGADGLI